MQYNRLPPEIVALIHQSELSRSGWFDEYKKRAVSTLLWLENEPLSPKDIVDKQAEVGVNDLTLHEARNFLEELSAEENAIRIQDEKYRLTESGYAKMTQVVDAAEQLEHDVIARFGQICNEQFGGHSPLDEGQLWKLFYAEFLIPLVQFFGAQTYEILTGSSIDYEKAPFVLRFLNRFEEENRPQVRRVIAAFLDPSVVHFRSYTLRLLNSNFSYIAHRYSRKNLEALYGGDKKPLIRCLLDTNFLYSILELHENPSNEAAAALLDTIKAAANYIDVRLYVFPPTIDELKRSLAIHEENLSRIRVTKSITDAVSDGDMNGVFLKFFKESAKSGYNLSAKDYFDPYQNNLIQVLRDKGVQIFNEKTEEYASDQRLIDDALDQQSFLTQRHAEKKLRGRPKSYDQIWHDVLLWYFVFDKRPAHFESFMEANFLGITIDYSLVGFDAYKRQAGISQFPVFIHPATLVQLFQFFVPVNEQFEAAIVDTLRLPVMFQEFSPESERTTVRILTRLSRFENIDDLSPETVRHVLENEILRDKIDETEAAEEEIALIREALIEENARKEAELREAREKQETFVEQIRELEGQSKAEQGRVANLESEIGLRKSENQVLRDEITDLESNVETLRYQNEERVQREYFLSTFVKWPMLFAVVLFLTAVYMLQISFKLRDVSIAALPLITLLLLWLYLLCWVGKRKKHVKSWHWFHVLNSIKLKLGAVLVAIYVSIVAAAYWGVINAYFISLGQ